MENDLTLDEDELKALKLIGSAIIGASVFVGFGLGRMTRRRTKRK